MSEFAFRAGRLGRPKDSFSHLTLGFASAQIVLGTNARDPNVTIYHTTKGQRVAFKTVKQQVKPGILHSLRIDFEGDEFTRTVEGKKASKQQTRA